ncbi:MAG: peptidase U62 [Alphaproteobacteria bacterium]|nr:peptidase U62 [Alphaproteobacteria bacterium]
MWWTWIAAAAAATPLDVVAEELERAMPALQAQEDPAHYAAFTLTETWSVQLSATDGTFSRLDEDHGRSLTVDLRVGEPELDSTHHLRANYRYGDSNTASVPIEDSPDTALRRQARLLLDSAYRDSVERLVLVRTEQSVRAEEENPAPDFEPRAPVTAELIQPMPALDVEAWRPALVALSDRLDAADVEDNQVSLSQSYTVVRFVDSEGSRVEHSQSLLRVSLYASTQAPDGDDVVRYAYVDVHSPEALPDQASLDATADALLLELRGLAAAPRGTPYSGPVLLSGKAAGVFFHEVMGHRVEGQRQKRDDEGKTFAEYVGVGLLPEHIDVYDDPALATYAGFDLSGHYAYDDEGVPAGRAMIVDDGVFTGFLTHRSPIEGFPESNGHGRRGRGRSPIARMGNLIVETTEPTPAAELRALLLAQVREQGLEYGLIVEDIAGGFTLTGRVYPNAFNIRAQVSRKVYADGRPDELVRGIDLVGTPLSVFGNLIAAGDDPEVFNGVCGAESGWVPVSAVSPSLLFSGLEVQRKEKDSSRPPLLPKPSTPGGDA